MNVVSNQNASTKVEQPALGILDKVGACLSFACAVHCLIMPLVITVLPLIGLGFFGESFFEKGMFIITISLATLSLCWGTRVHGNRRILLLVLAAFGLFWLGNFGAHTTGQGIFLSIGGLCLALGHILNRRLCRSCHHCCETPHA